ncbi:MAG: hypothetical protein FJ267_15855, partial [Planctomycetes bacterium]|nr:hypothetical protein [Planctomycetota bacterium]
MEKSHPQIVHRSSPWWNPLHRPIRVWFVGILLFVLCLPVATRWFFLSSVPAIPEPFDVEEFLSRDEPADEENAFIEYAKALELREKLRVSYSQRNINEPKDVEGLAIQGWKSVDESIREWLDDHKDIMEMWRRGTEKPQAIYIRPREGTYMSLLPVIQETRLFSQLAMLEVSRNLHEKKIEDAYDWVRAMMRCGGHVSQRSGHICMMVAVNNHRQMTESLRLWSNDVDISEKQFCTAFDDFRNDFKLYESQAGVLKMEYLMHRNTINSIVWSEYVKADGATHVDKRIPVPLHRMILAAVGEPELSLR